LTWGPVYWGLISAFIGFVLGFAIRLFIELIVKRRKKDRKGRRSEIILIVDCEETKAELVENIIWEHCALGVTKI